MTPQETSPPAGRPRATGQDNAKSSPKATRVRASGQCDAGKQSLADELLGSPTDDALAFLATHYAGLPGFANVVAIHPESGEIRGAGSPTSETARLRKFVEQHTDEWNLYFSVNPTRQRLNKKATKADIACAAYLHCDLDPRDGQAIATEKARLRTAARAFPQPPTTVIDSGNGIQTFWRLAKPLDAERAEALNERIAQRLGGDGCWNVDRVMRLPGTTNFPDARKRAKGRMRAPARLLRQHTRTAYAAEAFSTPVEPSALPAKAPAALPCVEVPARFYDDVLALDSHIRDRWGGSTEGLADKTGSAMDMSLVNLLVPHGFDDAEIAAIVRAFEHGTQREKTDRYIRYMLDKARAATQGESEESAWVAPSPIGGDEWDTARLTPDCVVENHFYADVGVFVAPGGNGKTTLILYQAIHIVLGLPLFGHEVRKPGPVVIVTAEDARERLVARLRCIVQELELDPEATDRVRHGIRIADVSGGAFRLTAVRGDVVVPNDELDRVINDCCVLNPVLVVFDPAVSFGVGESRVNDAEQGLIEAARKLRRACNCCVLYIHHTGKQVARDKLRDQYAGRGGSAFADGARMVHVLQTLDADEWRKETGGDVLVPGETGMVLARPKMSYCPPVADLFVKRSGYSFSVVGRIAHDPATERDEDAEHLWQYLASELQADRFHSQRSLEAALHLWTRDRVRKALAWLESRLRIESRPKPGPRVRGGSHRYLHPVGAPESNGAAIAG